MDRGQENYFRSLLGMKENIEKLLSFLEASFEEGSISEESYYELKGESLKKLALIEKKLSERNALKRTVDVAPPWVARQEVFPHELDELQKKIERAQTSREQPQEQVEHPEFSGLLKQKEDVESLLGFLEESYYGGTVSEASYQEARANNLKKLAEVKSKLASLGFKDLTTPSFVQAAEQSEAELMEMHDELPVSEEQPVLEEEPVAVQPKKSFGSMLKGLSDKVQEIKSQAIDKMPQQTPPVEQPAAQAAAAQEPTPGEPSIQEAVQAGRQVEAAQSGMGTDLKVAMDVEKLQVKVDALAEMRNAIEERLGRIMESIGEIRSMVFARESSLKELEAKVDKLSQEISGVEPQRYMKELDKRDRQLTELGMKIEKLEFASSDLVKQLNQVKGLLEGIGSLKNIVEVEKDITDKTNKINSMATKVERLSDEVGKAYIELNKKLDEFMLYRAKQDSQEESVKELVSIVDAINSKLDSFAYAQDLQSVREDFDSLKKDLVETKGLAAIAKASLDLPEKLKELKQQKEGIEELLVSIEEEFRMGVLTQEDYAKVREANLKKLGEYEALIQQEYARIADVQKARIGMASAPVAPAAPVSEEKTRVIAAAPEPEEVVEEKPEEAKTQEKGFVESVGRRRKRKFKPPDAGDFTKESIS